MKKQKRKNKLMTNIEYVWNQKSIQDRIQIFLILYYVIITKDFDITFLIIISSNYYELNI